MRVLWPATLALIVLGTGGSDPADAADAASSTGAPEARRVRVRGPGIPGATLDDATRAEVIGRLNDLLAGIYVIPSTADQIRGELEQRLAEGAFSNLDDGSEFASAVTQIMQEISHDQHLRLNSTSGAQEPVRQPVREPVRVVRRVGEAPDGGDGVDGPVRRGDAGGDGDGGAAPVGLDQIEPFPKAEMLSGNVGYVDIRLFASREWAEDAAVRVMEKLADADALIFDLRHCMGGFPDMVHLLTSYLYGPEPMHLLTYYHARSAPDSAFTLAEVPGRRLPDADVYILTSAFTASGGEEFTYNLKHHGRATVVGELTAGAGHGGSVHPVAAGFTAFVPDFRPVHPVTGAGWEAVGVAPDIAVDSDAALAVAHREVLRKKAAQAEESAGLQGLEVEIRRLDAEIERIGTASMVDPAALEEFVGGYGIRTITLDGKGLHLQRVGGPRLQLVPADSADEFRVKIMPDGRVRFLRNPAGRVWALEVLAPSGDWQRSDRDVTSES